LTISSHHSYYSDPSIVAAVINILKKINNHRCAAISIDALMNSRQDNNHSYDSNSVIAPIRENRRRINNSTTEGGDWENHPRGKCVLLCRSHLAAVEAIVDSFEHLSNNTPLDSPSDQLETHVRTALEQSLKLYYGICDIVNLYIDPDYPCPEDYVRFNQDQERTDGRYRPTIRRGIEVPSSSQVSPSRLRNNQG
jgi:hypothetical protein